MAKLITESDLTQAARRAGDGPKFLVAAGAVLTPGALEAARTEGVQVLYPGPGTRTLLAGLAEGVTDRPLDPRDLAKLEAQVFERLKPK